MAKILVIGGSGQLGTELCYLFDKQNINYRAPGSDELDITNQSAVQIYFEVNNPVVVFHCAAYTAVDAAEDEGKELNWKVNAEGTEFIAKASESVGATLIYISTDYVFDGQNLNDYYVDSDVMPRNEYGKAKLAGEEAVKRYSSNFYIVRTSWVFGKYGNNFVYTMLKLSETHKNLTVVSDQYGRPTWTKTLAEFLHYIYITKPEYGTYHLSNDDTCSWYEFACEILKDEDIEILPVSSKQYPQKAYRPRHSVMNLEKTVNIGFEIPTWRSALKDFLEEIDSEFK